MIDLLSVTKALSRIGSPQLPRLASSAFRRKLVRGLKRFVGYREGASW
ncbi:MAG: hypothetical protein M3461_13475 [Pseudomonadota bacterium]|nr:hypothetical protein [Pseudomonadota bacterium]